MTARKPIVLVDGQFQNLQAGDTLDATSLEVEVVQLTNKETGNIPIGTPVYVFGVDQVKKANAAAIGTKDVIGFVKSTTIIADAPGSIQTSGVLSATTGEWDAIITGGSGGLTFNTKYYLSAVTPGKLVTTPAVTGGTYVCPVGIAISTTELKINVESTILL